MAGTEPRLHCLDLGRSQRGGQSSLLDWLAQRDDFWSVQLMNCNEDRQMHPIAGVAGWISLAAAPTFMVMALLTSSFRGGSTDLLCSAAHGGLPLSGMAPMYLLMSAFHSAPWLKLISRPKRACRRSSATGFSHRR
jgi:hypothetical protein